MMSSSDSSVKADSEEPIDILTVDNENLPSAINITSNINNSVSINQQQNNSLIQLEEDINSSRGDNDTSGRSEDSSSQSGISEDNGEHSKLSCDELSDSDESVDQKGDNSHLQGPSKIIQELNAPSSSSRFNSQSVEGSPKESSSDSSSSEEDESRVHSDFKLIRRSEEKMQTDADDESDESVEDEEDGEDEESEQELKSQIIEDLTKEEANGEDAELISYFEVDNHNQEDQEDEEGSDEEEEIEYQNQDNEGDQEENMEDEEECEDEEEEERIAKAPGPSRQPLSCKRTQEYRSHAPTTSKKLKPNVEEKLTTIVKRKFTSDVLQVGDVVSYYSVPKEITFYAVLTSIMDGTDQKGKRCRVAWMVPKEYKEIRLDFVLDDWKILPPHDDLLYLEQFNFVKRLPDHKKIFYLRHDAERIRQEYSNLPNHDFDNTIFHQLRELPKKDEED